VQNGQVLKSGYEEGYFRQPHSGVTARLHKVAKPNSIAPQVIVRETSPGREIGARAFLFVFLISYFYFRERGNHEIEQQDEWQEIQVELKFATVRRIVAASAGKRWSVLRQLRCAFTSKAGPGGVPMSRARRRKRREQETDLRTSARIDLLQGVAAVEVRI